MNKLNNKQMRNIIAEYELSGRCAFLYPRKKMVSLNGHKAVDYETAYNQMVNCLQKERMTEADYQTWCKA